MANDQVAQSITARLQTIAAQRNVSVDSLRTEFLLERAVARLVHDTSDEIVLKGGFVSQRLYKTNRSTKDVDIAASSDVETVQRRLRSLQDVDLKDGCRYALIGINELKHELGGAGLQAEFYGWIGERVEAKPKDRRIRIDVTLSAPSLSRSVELLPLLGGTGFRANVVPPELTVAEKLHTLSYRGDLNSRARDVYDVFKMLPQCDSKALESALAATYRDRNGGDYRQLPDVLSKINPTVLRDSWRTSLGDLSKRVSFDAAWSFVRTEVTRRLAAPERTPSLDRAG